MDVLKSLLRSINLLGFTEKGGNVSVRIHVILVTSCLIIMNLVFYLIENWNDIDKRINAMRAAAFLATFFGYAVAFIFYWDELYLQLQLFSDMNYKIPYRISPRREEMINSLKRLLSKYNNVWWALIGFYTGSITLIPLIINLIKIVFLSQDIQELIKEDRSTPFPLYYPRCLQSLENLEWLYNIVVYILGYVAHTSFTMYTCLGAHLAHVTTLTSMSNVEYELKLLRLSLLEMNQLIQETDCNTIQSGNDACIRFIKYFLHHHQEAYRKFVMVNRGVRWVAVTVCTTASIYICMSLYVIVQKEQLVEKIQEITNLCVWVSATFLLNYSGERIKTEDEKLRDSLYECSWTDKSQKFKSSLLVAMTRNTKAITIQPFGLFNFTLSSFATIMNAAYSYYNLLRSFKEK